MSYEVRFLDLSKLDFGSNDNGTSRRLKRPHIQQYSWFYLLSGYSSWLITVVVIRQKLY